jgi:NADP-dependent 3-hydroxy acid dehydrogenase YdfG
MLGTIVTMKGMIHQIYGAIYNLEGLGSGGDPRVKGLSLYKTTKAGLKYLNDYLIMKAKVTPIIIGRIRPGMVATDMLTKQHEDHPKEWENAKQICNILGARA